MSKVKAPKVKATPKKSKEKSLIYPKTLFKEGGVPSIVSWMEENVIVPLFASNDGKIPGYENFKDKYGNLTIRRVSDGRMFGKAFYDEEERNYAYSLETLIDSFFQDFKILEHILDSSCMEFLGYNPEWYSSGSIRLGTSEIDYWNEFEDLLQYEENAGYFEASYEVLRLITYTMWKNSTMALCDVAYYCNRMLNGFREYPKDLLIKPQIDVVEEKPKKAATPKVKMAAPKVKKAAEPKKVLKEAAAKKKVKKVVAEKPVAKKRGRPAKAK